MQRFLQTVASFLRSEDGPTATEYAVLLALIAIGVLATMQAFGTQVGGLYSAIQGAVSSV